MSVRVNQRRQLEIDGRPTLVSSGSFHYYRLPAPALWARRLRALRGAGYRCVDLYFPWSYHSSAPGEYDFGGVRDVHRLLDEVERAGLYFIARPGPYINSELSGGGLPLWLRRKPLAFRCMENGATVIDEQYLGYVREWFEQIAPIVAGRPNLLLFQIENEYATDDLDPTYMRRLAHHARDFGVRVPLVHNDFWHAGVWADEVDVYSVDYYPIVSADATWRANGGVFEPLQGMRELFTETAPASPTAVLELQGGWFSQWDDASPDEYRAALGSDHLRLVTAIALAQGATIYNHYMACGGTNWGRIGSPSVCTSYDFAAPITERGEPSTRLAAARQVNGLARCLEDLFLATTNGADAPGPWLEEHAAPRVDTLIANERVLWVAQNLSGAPATVGRDFALESADDWETAWAARRGSWSMAVPSGGVNVAYAGPLGEHTMLHSEGPWPFHVSDSDTHTLIAFVGAGELALRQRAGDEGAGDEQLAQDYDGREIRITTASLGQHAWTLVLLPSADTAWSWGDKLVLGPDMLRVGTDGAMALTNDERVITVATAQDPANWRRIDAPAPQPFATPALGPWRWRDMDAEVRESSAQPWRPIGPDQPTDLIHLDAEGDIVWYRGTYDEPLSRVTLRLRHLACAYLNGKPVSALDSYQGEFEDMLPKPITLALPQAAQRAGGNELVLGIRNLGYSKGFRDDLRAPRGLIEALAERPIAWSYLPGWQCEREPGQMGSWREAPNLGETLSSDADVVLAEADFILEAPAGHELMLDLEAHDLGDVADIWLNGVHIARDWSMCRQRRFYLPEGVANHQGSNTLRLVMWKRGKPITEPRAFLRQASLWRTTAL